MNKAPRNLGDILGVRRQSPDVAVIEVDATGSEREWSCVEIETGSLAVAADLQSRGLKRGARIGILAANSVAYLLAYMGIMRAGFCCVPVNLKQPRDVIDFIIKDANIGFAYVDEAGAGTLPDAVTPLSLNELPRIGKPNPADCRESDPALFLYTSGSTGRPKGVVLSHSSQLSMIDAIVGGNDVKIFAGQRGIVVAPMFHMNALVFIASFLMGGGSIALMAKFDVALFTSLISKHQVNVITGVPTMIAILHKEWPGMGRPTLESVNTVYIGSAPVTEAIVHQSREMMPNAQVLNSYGTTETGGGLFGPHPKGKARPATSVGYPMPHVELRLNGGADEGELVVRTPSMMTEYLNLPDVTAERLRDGWYATGDLFRRDADGYFYFVGRADDMFVCSGENIYPGEVEKAIESHPAVVQSAVVPVDDEIRGKMPVAFVVRSGESLTEETVQEHVKETAAKYLYPRRVWFLEQLPLASTSKVDRKKLARDAELRMKQTSNIA